MERFPKSVNSDGRRRRTFRRLDISWIFVVKVKSTRRWSKRYLHPSDHPGNVIGRLSGGVFVLLSGVTERTKDTIILARSATVADAAQGHKAN